MRLSGRTQSSKFFEVTAWYGGDHYGGKVVDGYYHLTVFLDAFDYFLHSGERTVDDEYWLARLAEILLVVEINKTVVLNLCCLDEVLHLSVRHANDGCWSVFVLVRLVHDVA